MSALSCNSSLSCVSSTMSSSRVSLPVFLILERSCSFPFRSKTLTYRGDCLVDLMIF